MKKQTLRKIKRIRDTIFPSLIYKSKTLTGLYYTFLDSSFSREFTSVLAGKIKYENESKNLRKNKTLLIRNIHRIEKGILMRPRKEIFANDYITETIDQYENIFKTDPDATEQVIWFSDVLKEYFNVVSKENQTINEQRIRFQKIHNQSNRDQNPKKIPYHKINETPSVSFDNFFLLAKKRKSVRWFLDKPVERHLLDKAIEVAGLAPSACNRQPYQYYVIENPELVEKLAALPVGTKGYRHNIPIFIMCIGNLDAYTHEHDRHLIYIDTSLANMNLMLALETLGLSSCPINWQDIDIQEQEARQLLGLQTYQRPIMCLAVGYADPEGMVAFSERKEIDEIRIYK